MSNTTSASSVQFPGEVRGASTVGRGVAHSTTRIRARRRALSGPTLAIAPSPPVRARGGYGRMQWFGSTRDRDLMLIKKPRRPPPSKQDGSLALVTHWLSILVQRSLLAVLTTLFHQEWALVPYASDALAPLVAFDVEFTAMAERDMQIVPYNQLQLVPFRAHQDLTHQPHSHSSQAQALGQVQHRQLEPRRHDLTPPFSGTGRARAAASGHRSIWSKLVLVMMAILTCCAVLQHTEASEYTLKELEVLCGSEVRHLGTHKHRKYCPLLAKHPSHKRKVSAPRRGML